MLQKPRTSSFYFDELINIVFTSNSSLLSKPLFFYGKTSEDIASITFYIDNIFEAFKTYEKQLIFLYDYFFPCMVWSRLKLMLSKLKIGMMKIFALREEYKIGIRVRLKLDKIKKILTWPISQDQIAVREFLRTI